MTNKEMRKKLEEQFDYLATKSKSCEEKHLKNITNAMLDIYVVLNDSELLGYESEDTAQEVPVQEQYVTLKIDSKEIDKVVIDEIRKQQKHYNITLIPV